LLFLFVCFVLFFSQDKLYPLFYTENYKVFIQDNSYPIFYDLNWQSFSTRTHNFVIENGKVFFFSGEVVPNILWLKMTKFFTRRFRTQDLVGTNSPGELVPLYWWVWFLQEKSYPIFWVLFLLVTTSPEYDFSRSRQKWRLTVSRMFISTVCS
jgi:hypothetical protein